MSWRGNSFKHSSPSPMALIPVGLQYYYVFNNDNKIGAIWDHVVCCFTQSRKQNYELKYVPKLLPAPEIVHYELK